MPPQTILINNIVIGFFPTEDMPTARKKDIIYSKAKEPKRYLMEDLHDLVMDGQRELEDTY
jgi:hypothetical protein